MSIQLLLFDLDGTLVDTIRDITNALNYALNSIGIKKLTIDETKQFVGEGLTKLIEKVLGEGKKEFREAVTNTFLQFYTDHLIDYSPVYPHVKTTLERLVKYKKAVISNKREYLSTEILDKLKLLRYFDLVVGSDTTIEKKPSAVPILYVLQKLKARPEEAVMVGDSNFDIEAGRKAGVTTVAVTYGYRERQYLLAADHMIDQFNELPAILDIISSKFI
ncbi:MAG: HAD-IA family hydrolase [Thermodesulfovibrionales bacterium]|nr:HAD-IA family hydrolase [Thermodesulfovibrionales bacterium]